MYAEERQQAIARLVTQRGRMSVNQLAREYDVTTETVRRDLSTLERMGLVRRVHGGVVPPASLSLIEAGLRERDQVNTERRSGSRGPRSTVCHAAGGTILLDAGTTTSRLAALLPHDRAHRDHPRAYRSPPGSPAQPHVDLRLLPGRVRRTTQAAVGADTVAALSHAPRRRRVHRHERHHRRARPHHARCRRGRDQAGDGRVCAPGRGARRLLEVRRRDRRRFADARRLSTCWSPTTASTDDDRRGPDEGRRRSA